MVNSCNISISSVNFPTLGAALNSLKEGHITVIDDPLYNDNCDECVRWVDGVKAIDIEIGELFMQRKPGFIKECWCREVLGTGFSWLTLAKLAILRFVSHYPSYQ